MSGGGWGVLLSAAWVGRERLQGITEAHLSARKQSVSVRYRRTVGDGRRQLAGHCDLCALAVMRPRVLVIVGQAVKREDVTSHSRSNMYPMSNIHFRQLILLDVGKV